LTKRPELPQQVLSRSPAVPLLAIAAGVIWLVWQKPGPWGVVLAVAVTAVLGTRTLGWVERRTVALALGVLVAAVDYFTWRIGVVNWLAWWISVPLFVAEIFGAVHVLGLQYTIWPRREAALRWERNPCSLPTYVLVPTVDEGVGVLEPTLSGVITAAGRYRAVYPEARVTVVVCNDGLVAGTSTTGAVEDLCERLGVECVTRSIGGGAKAGNLEHARDAFGIHGEALFAIFDADQVPEPEFFLRTIPPFADPTVGWVQTGQYYRNLEEPVARWANDQQALFYHLVCPGKSAQNSVFICGTNVVIRAEALDEIGGFPQDSVTEDFAASIGLHGRWRSVYLEEVLATGLGPVDLGSYFGQQNRWARGTLSVLSDWRLILGRGRLRFGQRIQYALSCTHYLSGVRDLTYLLAPTIFVLFGIPAIKGATLDGFLRHFVPYFVVSQIAFWHRAAGRTTWRGVVIGFASFPTLLSALISVAFGRRRGFVLTSKRRGASSILPAVPHLVAAAVVLAAASVGAWRYGESRTLISVVWLLYMLAMLVAFLTLAVRDASRSFERTVSRAAGWFAPAFARALLRPAALGLLVPVAAAAAALPVIDAGSSSAAPFSGGLCAPRAVPLGVNADGAEFQRARALLGRVDVVGKTVELDSGFPRVWAERVRSMGATPWLTLTFTRHGQRTLDSSLRSIANGLHDVALARWAREAANFDRPILLTVLPAVDRNWSGTSAVAFGGIPQDVAPAWSRIRMLFAHAANVAFVWAPADPIRDQAFTPPADEIDVVQATWLRYPNTRWPDPERRLQAIAGRHPGKPILIDVSAVGPARRKQAWLIDVVRAAARRGAVVVYHEGGPLLAPAARGQRDWSLTTLTRAEVRSVARAAAGRRSACRWVGTR
jgi:cellulose synthase (UDP-forming)